MSDALNKRLQAQINFIETADRMKNVTRRNLLLDASRCETDAEHSWHFALMAMVLFEHCALPAVDLDRVIRMALVHDLVEIYAGDTYAYDIAGNADKAEREARAADILFAQLPGEQGISMRMLWEEFDAMQTPDAKYAAAIDRLQPFWGNYKTQGIQWMKHGAKKEAVMRRIAVVREALPAVWELVLTAVDEAVENGWLA